MTSPLLKKNQFHPFQLHGHLLTSSSIFRPLQGTSVLSKTPAASKTSPKTADDNILKDLLTFSSTDSKMKKFHSTPNVARTMTATAEEDLARSGIAMNFETQEVLYLDASGRGYNADTLSLPGGLETGYFAHGDSLDVAADAICKLHAVGPQGRENGDPLKMKKNVGAARNGHGEDVTDNSLPSSFPDVWNTSELGGDKGMILVDSITEDSEICDTMSKEDSALIYTPGQKDESFDVVTEQTVDTTGQKNGTDEKAGMMSSDSDMAARDVSPRGETIRKLSQSSGLSTTSSESGPVHAHPNGISDPYPPLENLSGSWQSASSSFRDNLLGSGSFSMGDDQKNGNSAAESVLEVTAQQRNKTETSEKQLAAVERQTDQEEEFSDSENSAVHSDPFQITYMSANSEEINRFIPKLLPVSGSVLDLLCILQRLASFSQIMCNTAFPLLRLLHREATTQMSDTDSQDSQNEVTGKSSRSEVTGQSSRSEVNEGRRSGLRKMLELGAERVPETNENSDTSSNTEDGQQQGHEVKVISETENMMVTRARARLKVINMMSEVTE